MSPVTSMTLRHVLEVPHGQEVFEVVEDAQRNRERQHHREAGVDGAGDEVRREDRGVPAGDDADRRSRSSRPCGPRAPAASTGRRAAGRPLRSAPSGAPSRAIRARACRTAAGCGWLLARSRSVARSGTSPTYQNISDTVR